MEASIVYWEVMESLLMVTTVSSPVMMVTGGLEADGGSVMLHDMVPNGLALLPTVKVLYV